MKTLKSALCSQEASYATRMNGFPSSPVDVSGLRGPGLLQREDQSNSAGKQLFTLDFVYFVREPRVPSPLPITLSETAPEILILGSVLSWSRSHLTPGGPMFQMNEGQAIGCVGGCSSLTLDQRALQGKGNGRKGRDLSQEACNDAQEQTSPF